MGRGSSKAGGSKGGAGGTNAQNANPTISTPSGVTYDQFMQMSVGQRYDLMDQIINDNNITVPNYLDDSITTKVIYALGMNTKPTIVSESQLDSMNGTDIFRTVGETGSMPPPSSKAILDQIRTGDFTQLSGIGGSVHGRALYFAQDFKGSARYGRHYNNSMVMRAKLNPNAHVVSEDFLYKKIQNSTAWRNHNITASIRYSLNRNNRDDEMSLFALANGIDGWMNSRYTMIVNRGALSTSVTNKQIIGSDGAIARSWNAALKTP